MILRSLIILILLTSLSACGHLDFRSKPANQPDVSSELPKRSPLPTPTQNNGLPDSNEQPEVATTPIEPAPVPIDLLTRISRGFAFPAFNSRKTSKYERWNAEHPTYLSNLFARGEPFLFHIVEEIEKRGLPMELALLPAVESAYKPNAISRSKAGGLWQFMPATGRYKGLRQDWWYDGRRDLIASTTAALDYLEELNKMFDGDWYTTLAAYNAGPGTLQRAIKKNKRNRKGIQYQDLKLRAETVNYVPKLIALKNILNDAARFRVTLPVIANQPHFVELALPGQIDLHKFSEQSGIDLSELQHLNAGFRRWASSPDGPHRLLVPLRHYAAAQSSLANIASAPVVNYRSHAITQGDTLSGISRKYGVSVHAIKNVNKMSNSAIRAGRNLLIPIPQANQGNNSITASNAMANGKRLNANGDAKLVHHVVVGDTLWSIARKYQVKIGELLSWNQLSRNQILSLDQKLTVFPN